MLNAEETSIEDLIKPQDMVVTLTHGRLLQGATGRRIPRQKRGGRGKQATATKEEDFVEKLSSPTRTTTSQSFSNRGRVLLAPGLRSAGRRPQQPRQADREPVPAAGSRKITAIVATKTFEPDKFIFMATSMGTVKKTSLEDFSRSEEDRHHRGRPRRWRLP